MTRLIVSANCRWILPPCERLGRKERGHQPKLEKVVAEGGDHVDKAFPLRRRPAVYRNVVQDVGIEGVLQVLGEVDVADPHGELRAFDHVAQFRLHRLALDGQRSQDLDESIAAAERLRRPADQQFARLRIADPLDHETLRTDRRFQVQQAGSRQSLHQRVGVAHHGDDVSSAGFQLLLAADRQGCAARALGEVDDPVGRVAQQLATMKQHDVGRGPTLAGKRQGHCGLLPDSLESLRPDLGRNGRRQGNAQGENYAAELPTEHSHGSLPVTWMGSPVCKNLVVRHS